MSFVIRLRRIFNNKLFHRKQLTVEIAHPDRGGISKQEIAKHLAQKYKSDEKSIIVYGLRTQFGGGRTKGFALVYDNIQYLLKYEPKFRLRRKEILPKREGSRKGWKEVKTKIRKTRGKERSKLYMGRKRDKVYEITKIKRDYLKNFA